MINVPHVIGYVYACDYCDYRATTSSNLRRHARLHLATRPYRCPHCQHTFVELSALRRHVLDSAYHPGQPLYVCPWCSVRSIGRSRHSDTSPVSLIIDSPIATGVSGVCGFNSSNLAWKHVVEAHADELSAPETLIRLGKKPGETLIEVGSWKSQVGKKARSRGISSVCMYTSARCVDHLWLVSPE